MLEATQRPAAGQHARIPVQCEPPTITNAGVPRANGALKLAHCSAVVREQGQRAPTRQAQYRRCHVTGRL